MSELEFAIAEAREAAASLRSADRHGSETDTPEGARWVMLSHTAANRLADVLDRIATAAAAE